MLSLLRVSLRWATLLIICFLLIQGVWGRPRLRHSHRKFRCSKCPPGWGVLTACTEAQDTVCGLCGPGRYSPHHSFKSPCWLCSRCGPGLYEAHPCKPAADTVCDDCNRAGIVANQDYLSKCNNTRTSKENHNVLIHSQEESSIDS